MRTMTLAAIAGTALCACVDETEPTTTDVEAELGAQVFSENFDDLVSGPVGGQNGWSGNCVVTDEPGNKYLRCARPELGGQRWANKATNGLEVNGSYFLRVVMWPNVNVEDATHGKFSLEGPSGRVFQLIAGCDGIKVAFQNLPPVVPLLTRPCGGEPPPPTRYQVVCTWSTTGNVLRCGAAPSSEKVVTNFVNLPVQLPWRSFNRVDVMAFDRPGATLFDDIYIERL